MSQHTQAIPAQLDLENDDHEMHPIEVAEFFDEDNTYYDEWHRENLHRRGKDGRTDHCKGILESLPLAVVASRLEEAFIQLKALGLDVTNLIFYITYLQGRPEDTGKIKYARTALLQCNEFPMLLRKWRNGRDRVHNKGISTMNARQDLDEFSVDNVSLLVNQEMRALAPYMNAPIGQLTVDKLLQITMDGLEDTMMKKAPTLWSVLHHASSTPKQLESLTYKSHSTSIILMIAICAYRRSQHRCLMQQLNSIYFKAHGLASRAHDTTHAYGLTMSHSWSYSLIDKLSADAKKHLLADIAQGYPFRATHDNLNLSFKVYEQRTNKQSRFDSGTAATIYIIKNPDVAWPSRERYLAHRAAVGTDTITDTDISMLDAEASVRLRERAINRVLRFLTEADPFDFPTYEFNDSDVFAPLPPLDQLPTGSEGIPVQYMLDTVTIESASQEGTRKCLDEWLRQLERIGPEEILKDDPLFKHTLVLMGDQLTTVRVRSVKKDRSEDFNFIQRLEHFVEIFGWFHAQLAEETSIHKQYYTTHKVLGLQHGFDLLNRKGLHSSSVKGAFHHGMHEALLHMAMAHFRDLWVVVGKVESLADLRTLPPDALKRIATTIVEEHASRDALTFHRKKSADKQDKAFINGVQFCYDVLNYLELDEAMSTGDVGRMQDMLPRLLFRFNGGGSSNYAIELLELLQGLHKEWTPELKSFILHYCWLARAEGKKISFLSFDMIQEHNIRDIKQLFAAQGPYATWEYIKRISASIPAQRKIKDHVEREFNHFSRGKSHTKPAWEGDVANLQAAYHDARIHLSLRNRTAQVTHSVPDFVGIGGNHEKLEALVDRWRAKRVSERSTEEEYGEHDGERNEGVSDVVVGEGTIVNEEEVSIEDEILGLLASSDL